MPQTFIVDQAATFQAVAFLGAEPRTVFGSAGQQELTKEGLPRWDVQVVAGFRDNFGKINNEVIKVSFASRTNPAEQIGMYTPVHLVNFTVGVMEKKTKDKASGEERIVGVQVWYRADDIRPTSLPAPATSSSRSSSSS